MVKNLQKIEVQLHGKRTKRWGGKERKGKTLRKDKKKLQKERQDEGVKEKKKRKGKGEKGRGGGGGGGIEPCPSGSEAVN